MNEPDLSRAVDACLAVASDLSINVDDALILHNSNRLAVQLLPGEALARVAHVSHQAGAEFEVEVARHLAANRSPVAQLFPGVEPRAYVHRDFAVTLWTYYGPFSSRISAPEYGHALNALHAGMRQLDIVVPHFTHRVATAQALLDDADLTPDLAETDRRLLSDTMRLLKHSIASRGANEQPLHGEPHPGNLLSTSQGLLFIDLETCCRGPVEFDVAHAPRDVAVHIPDIDHDLVRECRLLVLAMIITWRWDRTDQLPNGRERGAEWLIKLRLALDDPELDVDL